MPRRAASTGAPKATRKSTRKPASGVRPAAVTTKRKTRVTVQDQNVSASSLVVSDDPENIVDLPTGPVEQPLPEDLNELKAKIAEEEEGLRILECQAKLVQLRQQAQKTSSS